MKNSKLVVFRPIKTNWLSQGFGQNFPCAKLDSNGNAIRPFKIVSAGSNGVCNPGTTKFYPLLGLKGHNGWDNKAHHGEPLYFPVECEDAGGWFAREASDQDGGIGVDVISNKPVTLEGRTTYIKFRFWHLQRAWKDNDVLLGELSGFCDNSGASTGDHLHWCMKRCLADGTAIDKDNGYYGAVDFFPYYEDTFVLDYIKVRAQALTAIAAAHKVILEVKLFIKKWIARENSKL